MSPSNKGFQVEHVGKLVKDSVQSGKFLPFLGAGSSGLRPSDPEAYPWDQVSDRMSLLMAHLEQEEDRQYLRSQADAHGIALKGGDDYLPSKPDKDDHLFSLQKGLVRLGSDLIYLFGQEMSRARRCVSELVDYQVEVSGPRRERLLELLLDTADAARNLAEAREAERVRGFGDEPDYPNLEARAIYEKLFLFTCRTFGQLDKVCHEMRERLGVHQVMQKELDLLSNVGREPYLRLDELAWLEDLLWHTLRYQVPAYPTTTDLTFHLSLTASVRMMRRGSLPQVAELHGDDRAQVECVRDWFRFCEDEIRRKPPRSFHLSVAAALYYEFQKYKQAKDEGNRSYLPIAFTTNYDRTIENALACLNVGRHEYHVVFPVRACKGVKESGLSKVWILTTYGAMPSQDHPTRIGGPYDCTVCEFDELKDYVRGPILVKLHGSPLEELGDYTVHDIKGGMSTSYKKLEHSLVLSESSYMAAIVGGIGSPRALPTWIEKALGASGRDLWFLGYSVSDWNVRLRLYDHLRYLSELPGEKVPTKAMFDRRYDVLKSAILDTLRIQQYEGELHTFGAYLRRIREIGWMVESTLKQWRI